MSATRRSTSVITRGRAAVVLLAVVFVLAALAGSSFRAVSAGAGDSATVIVELKGEPAAVYAARARAAGRTVSTDELQSYRAQLTAQQDKFLAALASRGVTAQLASRGVKNYDGSLAATILLRYALVYNGLALKVPAASVPALRAMPEVKGVRPDALLYRVRGLHDGQIGFYVTPASAAQGVLVDRRTLVDITNAVQTAMSNVTFASGVFQLDLNLTNATANTYLPYVLLRVVGVSSASGTVRVSNADNGGAGMTISPAVFDYSTSLGSDQTFAGGEITAARTLRFADARGELFTYDIQVTAYQRASGAGGGAAAGGNSGGSAGGTSQSGLAPTSLIRVAANPLTKSVSVKLVGALK
ncbi:MAG: hypothetical protein QOH49_4836 [Acidobacteriota bacterium]|jgi:hypothetical protein|nr:hypothetical protein [Acidobacteriota bacterium]